MEANRKMCRKDFIILVVLVILYSILSFYHLGSMDNPNTFVNNGDFYFEVEDSEKISKLRYFTGREVEKISISYSIDGENYIVLDPIESKYCFAWYDFENFPKAKKYKIHLNDKSNLGEVAFLDDKGELLSVKAMNTKAQVLIDESKTVPKEISYLNSTYFDEIYFARTAYEYANELPAYEWVHPPLGKLIMAVPIKIFKMAPFYYRLMGNIAGILMIPVLYIFAKRMFKKTKYAAIASLLLALDGFHFVQTRMATVDSFLVLFLLLAFLFMYEYFLLPRETRLHKKLIKLFLSGLFMGLAISVKWTALFGALALAILFFIHFFKNYNTKELWKGHGKDIIIYCVLFFFIIPVVIYLSCYLLFPNMYYFQTDSFQNIGLIMKNMFSYHSSLKDDHAFYSSWYTWPIMLKPVWYYVKYAGELKGTISGFGNPIVWWIGALGMVYMIYKTIRKEKNAFFLLLTYICMLISYVGISRGMFLYHYFPAFPFTILAATYLIKDITEKTKKNYIYLGILILVIFFFIYFFPILTGELTDVNRIERLKWFSTWIF